MFLHLSLSHSVHGGGGLPQCMLGYTTHHHPGQTPPRQTPPGRPPPPPGGYCCGCWDTPPTTPLGRHPPDTPPPGRHPPPPARYCSGGTHPTGMQSCLMVKSNFFYKSCSSTLPHSAGQIVRSMLSALQFKATLCVLICGLYALYYDLGSVLNTNISNSNSS